MRGIVHTVHVGDGQLRHGRRARVKRAIADDFRQSVVKVDTGCEGEIHAAGQQLRRHQPTHAACHRHSAPRILVKEMADSPRRRQRREFAAKALHAPTLMVHGQQQCRGA